MSADDVEHPELRATGLTRQVGRYRLERELGRGSMGVVYLGYDPLVERAVALKVAHEPGYRDSTTRQMFRTLFFNEMRAASILCHPNIVEVLDVGVEGDAYFIAMEYVEGGLTLENWCHADRLLPIDEALVLVARCARALDYAHQRGVIHRDVKPGNILYSADGEVKLADFSVALLTDPSIDETQLLAPVGSPLYMAPEQFRAEGVTHQSDVFSLGNVLYELLTGRLPFAADTLAALTHNVLSEAPAPVSRWRPGVPPEVEDIVNRALARDPLNRFDDAMALADALDAAAGLGNLGGSPDSTTYRADQLAGMSFFTEFGRGQLWELLRCSDWIECDAGTTVTSARSDDAGLYLVVEGEVRSASAQYPTGACFNAKAFSGVSPADVDAVTVGRTVLLRIEPERLSLAELSCRLRLHEALLKALLRAPLDD